MDEYKQTKKEISKKAALFKLTVLCSRQEKCCSDMRKKLYDWQISPKDHDELIDYLLENKYIDEERFVEAFVRDKFKFNKWGKIKISYHLRQKEISNSLINQFINEINEEEYLSTLKKLADLKNKSLREEDIYKRKVKLMRNLASKGFESNLIVLVLEDLLNFY